MCVGVGLMCSSQKEAEQEELEAGKAVHYTWTEPTGSRELCWKCGTYSGTLKSEEVLCLRQRNVCALINSSQKTLKYLTLKQVPFTLTCPSAYWISDINPSSI